MKNEECRVKNEKCRMWITKCGLQNNQKKKPNGFLITKRKQMVFLITKITLKRKKKRNI
jgi:hypothetical protein